MSTKTLLKRWVGIATGKNRVAVKQDVGRHYSLDKIEGYYNDLTGKVNEATLLDDDGIPVNIIEGGRKVYFPISIFQYALGLYDLYLENGSEETKLHFLKLCGWTLGSQEENGSWNCFGPIGYRTLTVSSMGQGEAASVLARAYVLTNEDKWLEGAKKAVGFMLTDLNDGGTLRREDGKVILEEYADLEGSKKSVLNGWIFSVFGLFDYLKLTDDAGVRDIFDKTVETMADSLPLYDCGYWSLYDQTGRLASPAYHELHIALLTVMHDITGREAFARYAEKWMGYNGNIIKKGFAIFKKILQKLGDSPEGIVVQ